MIFSPKIIIPAYKPPSGIMINRGHPLAQGLCGCWIMNECGGLNLNDLASYGNGTLGGSTGTPSWENAGFVTGSDLAFVNANTQKVTVTNNAQYLNNSFSIACAFRLDALRNYNALVTKTNGNAGGPFDMYVDGSGVLQFFVANNSSFSSGANPQISGLSATTWYTTHCTWDKNGGGGATSTAYAFLNGIQKASATTTASNVVNGSKNIIFGTRDDAGTILGGKIAFVKIWDRLLNPTEVMYDYLNPYAIFNMQHRLFLPATSVVALSLTFSDSISLSDAQGNAAPLGKAFTDFISLSDTIIKSAQFFSTQNDTITLSDTIALLLQPIANINISDSLALSDLVATQLNSIFLALNVSVSDSLSLLDAINSSSPQGISINDSLILSDSVCVVLQSTLRSYIRKYLNDVV